MNHTPGPWKAIYDGDEELAISAPKGDPDLRCDSWQSFAVVYVSEDDGEAGLEKAAANARLIAAAPEMLSTLEYLVTRLEDITDIRLAEEVIAKAKGEK